MNLEPFYVELELGLGMVIITKVTIFDLNINLFDIRL